MIQLKRAYEAPSLTDGYRILVDRIWPRGLTKEKEQLDLWLKEIGPSRELRQALHQQKISFAEFTDRYQNELNQGEMAAAWQRLQQLSTQHPTICLIFASKNVEQNQAVVLKQMLEKTPS